jgi:hypothetical protein
VHQGLFVDRDRWAKELLEGLMFADPSKDWHTHMMQLKPIEKGVACLAKQTFADSYREFDSDPTDPESLHRQRSTYCHLIMRCTMLTTAVCWSPQHISVLTCP